MTTTMNINTHQGMRGTADWTHESQRPLDWDAAITELFMNADAPLTALTKLLPSSKAKDPKFLWYREDFPAQAGPLGNVGTGADSSVYDSSALNNLVTGAIAAGTTRYVKLKAKEVGYFRPRLIVMLRSKSDPRKRVYGRVLNQILNGDSSYIVIQTLQSMAPTGGTTVGNDLDYYTIIGDSNPEGGPPPRGIAYDPEEFYNFTQISKTAIELTRTAELTELRHENELVRMRKNSLRDHAVKREKMFLYGIPSEATGDNGKKERTTGGILWFIHQYAPQNVFHLPTVVGDNSDYSEYTPLLDKTWEQGGFDFLNLCLERIYNYGNSDSRIAYCGSGTIQALQRLAKFNGNIQLNVGATEFGLKVITWITPFGALHFKTHPLFKYDATERYSALIIDPSSLERKVISETFTKKKDHNDGGFDSLDGRFEEFITEDGLKFTLPESCGYITGFGSNFETS